MPVCPHHRETLVLDIYDELNGDFKASWESHLSGCSDCRAEKEALTQTLKMTKMVFDAPSLGEAEAAAMRGRVIRDLTMGTKGPREKKQPFFFSRAFVPLLASACVLLIALGFIVSRSLTGPIGKSTDLAALQGQPQAEDIDIINNMDLLGDLDALNRLAKVIDQAQPSSQDKSVQGKNGNGKRAIFS